MNFSEIKGHEKLKQQWEELILNNRLPHASLILGGEGSGKLALAWSLIRRIFCQKSDGLDACDNCADCAKTRTLNHSDLILTFPYPGANRTSNDFSKEWREAVIENPFMDMRTWMLKINALKNSPNIPTKEISRISQQIQMHSYEGGPKVQLIWGADYLGKGGNKLLKFIEEPPENTYIIMIAPNEEKILSTIVSRCQTFYVKPFTPGQIEDMLISYQNVDPEKASEVTKLSEGNISKAFALAEGQNRSYSDVFLPWLRDCYTGNGAALVEWSEKIAKFTRSDQKYLITYSLHFLRQLPLFKIGLEEKILLGQKEMNSARNLSNLLTIDKISGIQEILDETMYSLERNALSKLVFLTASIRINQKMRED